jgi:hypothetical protein
MPRTKASTAKKAEKKEYLVERKSGKFTVEVPGDWKVTFGAMAPGGKNPYSGHGGWTLRFYETKEKQRAVFTDVVSFRDLSIPVKKLVQKVDKESTFKSDGKGNTKATDNVKVEEFFVKDVDEF